MIKDEIKLNCVRLRYTLFL